MIHEKFINIKYIGQRFNDGKLPLDILKDIYELSALIRKITKIDTSDIHNSHIFSLTGIQKGSAVPCIELQSNDEELAHNKPQLLPESRDRTSRALDKGKRKLYNIIRLVLAGEELPVDRTYRPNIKNFLKGLKEDETLILKDDDSPINDQDKNLIIIDFQAKKRISEWSDAPYTKEINSCSQLVGVSLPGNLTFKDEKLGNYQLEVNPDDISHYGSNISKFFQTKFSAELETDPKKRKKIKCVKHTYSIAPLPKQLELPTHVPQINLEQQNPSIIDKIKSISTLQDGWLNGEGQAPSSSSLKNARDFLKKCYLEIRFYAVAPTVDGGILLEYKIKDWDLGIEFQYDNSLICYGYNLSSGEEIYNEMNTYCLEALIEKMKEVI